MSRQGMRHGGMAGYPRSVVDLTQHLCVGTGFRTKSTWTSHLAPSPYFLTTPPASLQTSQNALFPVKRKSRPN